MGVVAHGVLLVNHGVLVTLGVLLRFGRAGGVFGMDAQAGRSCAGRRAYVGV